LNIKQVLKPNGGIGPLVFQIPLDMAVENVPYQSGVASVLSLLGLWPRVQSPRNGMRVYVTIAVNNVSMDDVLEVERKLN